MLCWHNIKHPEVINIGFLTLLFAGTTSIFSLKYSILNDTVKKFKQWSPSAGNHLIKNETSETLRNGTVVEIENVKRVTIHVPRHLKPVSEDQFGHYLAGLIDGDGHFSTQQQLVIVFNSLDVSLAYYVKERLGFGKVKKVKDKNAFILVIIARKSLEKVINLINGKIRTENKFNQIIINILNHDSYVEFKKTIQFRLNLNDDLNNHWLAGFSDADASFQIKVLNCINKVEVRLNFQIDQKKEIILLLIKTFLGGNIGYRKSQDTYTYSSSTYGTAKRIIKYFDNFNLQSRKHIDFLRWRKTYVRLCERLNLTHNPEKEYLSSLLVSRKFNKTIKNINLSPYNNRYYTTNIADSQYSPAIGEPSLNKLNPFWVTGFSDGDSSFTVKFKKRMNLTWQILPVFQIGLNIKDKDIVYKIQYFFNGVGIVSFDHINNIVYYTINKIKELNLIVIPHLDMYPLLSDKKIDYDLWVEIVKIIVSKNHLRQDGFFKILSLKRNLNRGLSPKLKEEFPNIDLCSRPELEISNQVINNNWIAGFTAAEGSFSITINEKDGRNLPQVRARFSIGLHKKDINILTRIKNQLNLGNIYSNNKGIVSFEVGIILELETSLIPFFDAHDLNNIKHLDFLAFKKVISIIKNKEHLSKLGLSKIRTIKSEMNLLRKECYFS